MDENSFKPAVRYRESSNPCGRIAVQLALLKENIYWVVKGKDILGGARLSAHLTTHFPTRRTTVIRGQHSCTASSVKGENIYEY